MWPYPFLPRHLTIIDTLTIGVPTFFLALAPNPRRYRARIRRTRPALRHPGGAIVVAASVVAAYALARSRGLALVEQRTSATLVALMLSLTVLVLVALPLTWRRALLVGSVAAGFVLLFPDVSVRNFYALALPTGDLTATLLIGAAGAVSMVTLWAVARRRGSRASDAAREVGP